MSRIIFLSFLISLTISSFGSAMSRSPAIIENCPEVQGGDAEYEILKLLSLFNSQSDTFISVF